MFGASARGLAPGERIRVVSLIGSLGYGGSQRQLYLALRHLDAGRFERHVVVFNTSSSKEYVGALRNEGIEVWRIPAECRTVPARLRFLTGLLADIKPHVVHSWTAHDNPYAGIVGLLTRARRLGSVRGSWSAVGLERMGRVSRLLSLYAVTTLVVNAASIVSELSVYPGMRRRMVLTRNAFEVDAAGQDSLYQERGPREARRAVLADLGVPPDGTFVLMVANLRTVKNYPLFIEAIAAVTRVYPDVRGVVVGQVDPTELRLPEALRAQVRDLGVEQSIIFAGFRDDVPRLLRESAAVCLTSDQEGFPNVVVEAMAAGRPVVATAVGGVPELVEDGVTGLLVAPGDVTGMTAALMRVLSDDEFALRLGTAAQRFVRGRFGADRAAGRLAALYTEGLSEGRR